MSFFFSSKTSCFSSSIRLLIFFSTSFTPVWSKSKIKLKIIKCHSQQGRLELFSLAIIYNFSTAKVFLLKYINKTAWKVSKYGVFSGSYFPLFRANTEIYSVNRSDYGKIRTTKNSVSEHCSNSVRFKVKTFHVTNKQVGKNVSSSCSYLENCHLGNISVPLLLKIHDHCVKSVRIRSFSGLYFPAFGLNTGQ